TLNVVLLVGVVYMGSSSRFFDPAMAAFNTVMYWNLYDRPLTLRENARIVDVVYFADGLNSTITVTQTEDYVSLRTNGKVDASNPWIAGVAALFTREFYRAAHEHLAPGGIFVQWVQGYSLFPDDLRMIFATFLSEFQGATLWHGDAPDFLLMAPSPPATQLLD